MSNSPEKEKEPVLKESPVEAVPEQPQYKSEPEQKEKSGDFPKLDARFEVLEELGAAAWVGCSKSEILR